MAFLNRLGLPAKLALAVLALLAAVLVFGPMLYEASPTAVASTERLQPPSLAHPLGTDQFGREVLARVLAGGQQSLRIAAITTLLTVLIGGTMGLAAGYLRRLDEVLMRICDAFMALPAVILAIALMAVSEPSEANVILALVVVYTPRMARLVRSRALLIREMPYVEAALALGARSTRIVLRHVLPNALPEIIVLGSFIFGYAILDEAALSFLGVGAPPPAPSWGNMLSEARYLVREAFWISFFPGLFIGITVLAVNLLGDGIRDAGQH
ncbi:MAG TPA: ABC transporter permease [Ramlibacter sp.]|uniref:ABC transporter permease n=1 Tax=Ramlibacter sp. TaxID=1917967 RepID=UPI002CE95746|nr:ABC transporter permease [Ramlibacter sp.]HVZ44252.1 ABC transporter permease [Ramlibacter sp.]